MNATFLKSKVGIRIENKNHNFDKPTAAWIIYKLSKLVYKIGQQSAGKKSQHKHLGAYTLINDTF